MSMFHAAGQNRLLALEQELFRHRAYRHPDKQENEQERLEETELDAEESFDKSELDNQIEYIIDDLEDELDEIGSSSEPNVYHSFIALGRPDQKAFDPKIPDREADNLSTAHISTAHINIDQSDSFSYEALAMLLTDANRSGKQSIDSYPTDTQTRNAWADLAESEVNPFTPPVLTSAQRYHSPHHSLQPDSFIPPESEPSIAPSPSSHLPDIKLPELDSEFSAVPDSAFFEEESSNREPSYATLSWMLQEGRQRDFHAPNELDDESDDLFDAITKTIDIEAEAITKDESQEFD